MHYLLRHPKTIISSEEPSVLPLRPLFSTRPWISSHIRLGSRSIEKDRMPHVPPKSLRIELQCGVASLLVSLAPFLLLSSWQVSGWLGNESHQRKLTNHLMSKVQQKKLEHFWNSCRTFNLVSLTTSLACITIETTSNLLMLTIPMSLSWWPTLVLGYIIDFSWHTSSCLDHSPNITRTQTRLANPANYPAFKNMDIYGTVEGGISDTSVFMTSFTPNSSVCFIETRAHRSPSCKLTPRLQ